MSGWGDWLAAAVSLTGAALAYVGARRGSRPDAEAVTESRRDEWGRRFTTAIDLMGDPDERRRSMGRALLDGLLDSDLAQPDDKRIAERLLLQAALTGPGGVVAHEVGGRFPAALDDVIFVEDDGLSR